jgi:2-methylcitrate dehydratase
MCVSFSRKPGFALFGWSLVVSALADHSLPFITARAMFDGDITNESFAAEKFRDPAVLTFMQKIKVAEDPALTARGGTAVPTRVTAILADGQRVSREVDHAPGFAARPMSRNEVERKFRGNVGDRVGAADGRCSPRPVGAGENERCLSLAGQACAENLIANMETGS